MREVTNYVTSAEFGYTNAQLKVYQRHIVEETHPTGFSWIAFTLIALVVLFFTHRFVYRSGHRAGRYQEQVDRFNNGA